MRWRPTPYPFSFSNLYNLAGERPAGDFDRAYLQMAYPLLLTVERSVKVAATYEHVDYRTSLNPLPALLGTTFGFGPGSATIYTGYGYGVNRDQYSVARFASDSRAQIPSWWEWGGTLSLLTIYSHGLGGRNEFDAPILGAIGTPLSRPFASPDFDRFALKARLDLGLPENFHFAGIFRGQTDFGKALVLPENLSLDGAEAVSGYAAGTLNVDRGLTLRSELSRPVSVDWPQANNVVAPYLFAAYGRGTHETTFVGEQRRLWVETLGGGLRADTSITGSPYGESLLLEFGKDYSNIPFHETGYRANVSFNVKFAGDSLYAAPFAPEKTRVTKGPKAAPGPTDIWTGAYVGLNAGYAWDPQNGASTFGAPAQSNLDSFLSLPGLNYGWPSALGASGATASSNGGILGGGQIGYNYLSERLMMGFEADLQGSNPSTRGSIVGYGQEPITTDTAITSIAQQKNVEWLGTARGRLGFLPWPNLLAYATGGLAYGRTKADAYVTQFWNGPIIGPLLNSIGSVGHFAGDKTGWTIGAGLEWMFAPNVSLKGEILYYDLGAVTFAASPLFTQFSPNPSSLQYNSVALSTRAHFQGDLVRVGLNYHFNDAGAVAAAAMAARLPDGFYAGLNAGYTWDESPRVVTTAAPVLTGLDTLGSFSTAAALGASGVSNAWASGYLGGGQLGYNWFWDKFVLGVETDLQGAGARGRGDFWGAGQAYVSGLPIANYQTYVETQKSLDWLGTTRARFGFLVTPALLAYGTGGVGYGGVSARTFFPPTATFGIFPGSSGGLAVQASNAFGDASSVRGGWTAGGGLEFAFGAGLSLKAEYLYYDLGATTFGSNLLVSSLAFNSRHPLPPWAPIPPTNYLVSAVKPLSQMRSDGQNVRIGLNYHFDLLSLAPSEIK